MTTSRESQLIGMAGAVLATQQALLIAREGRANESASKLVLEATLRLDAESAAAVYGGMAALRPALAALRDFLQAKDRDPILVRSLIVLMQLERNFSARADLGDRVAAEIRAIDARGPGPAGEERDDMPGESLAASLGEIYARTVSQLTPRVMIPGDPQLLSRATIVTAVRAHLLAALRGVVLWRQSGGSRFGLLINWRALRSECERLLE